jgi:hypothetical protein
VERTDLSCEFKFGSGTLGEAGSPSVAEDLKTEEILQRGLIGTPKKVESYILNMEKGRPVLPDLNKPLSA